MNMSEISNQKRKALKDLSVDLCDRVRSTLKADPKATFWAQGVYQANINVIQESSKNEPNQRQMVQKDVLIVNPLEHAWKYYERYLDLVHGGQKILFVAMNSVRRPPIGIPFYENDYLEKVFKGLEISANYLKNMGSEVIEDSESGRIFWGVMRQYFGTDFFKHCFVLNYCPLIFTDTDRAFNIPLSDLDHEDPLVNALVQNCHDTFIEIVKILKPDLIVSIGTYTHQRMMNCLPENYYKDDRLRSIHQPISITYQQTDVWWKDMEYKITEWKKRVREGLENNAVWNNVTGVGWR